MFNMMHQLFTAIATFCVALQKFAKASEHIATWTEERAGAFADEARVQRAAALIEQNKANNLTIEMAQ